MEAAKESKLFRNRFDDNDEDEDDATLKLGEGRFVVIFVCETKRKPLKRRL